MTVTTCVPPIFGKYAVPAKLGDLFFNGVVNNTVVTIVEPGANENGIRLGVGTTLGDGIVVLLFAATSAPSSYADTTKQVAFQLDDGPGVVINLEIPAGLGLYAASGANVQFCISYDIL